MISDETVEVAARAINPYAFGSPHPTWKPGGYVIKMRQRIAREQARAALEAVAALGDDRERVRHKKRGSTYHVIGRGELQSSDPVAEGAELVAYRCSETNTLWFRPATEFDDGRFEELK